MTASDAPAADLLAAAADLRERVERAVDEIESVLAGATGFGDHRIRELIAAHDAARSARHGLCAIAAVGRTPSQFASEHDERAIAAAERVAAAAET